LDKRDRQADREAVAQMKVGLEKVIASYYLDESARQEARAEKAERALEILARRFNGLPCAVCHLRRSEYCDPDANASDNADCSSRVRKWAEDQALAAEGGEQR
jgi:hypothetical protein